MQKVVFWADADFQIGFGHFYRTLALVEMLRDDFECHFCTKNPTEFQKERIQELCTLHDLPDNEDRFDQFVDSLEGNEIVFLDNYFFTSDFQRKIKDRGCRLVVLSPADRHHYADIVINYVEEDLSKYSIEPYTCVATGLEWIILRKPFLEPLHNNARKTKMVTVCFGGTDSLFLSGKVIVNLKAFGWDLHCVCTDLVSVQYREKLKDSGAEVHVNLTAEEMSNLFEQSEFAILSSSTICNEAISRGCKVMAGYYVDNQKKLYQILLKNGCIEGIGDLTKFDFTTLPKILNEMDSKEYESLNYSDLRQRYIQMFRNLCT